LLGLLFRFNDLWRYKLGQAQKGNHLTNDSAKQADLQAICFAQLLRTMTASWRMCGWVNIQRG